MTNIENKQDARGIRWSSNKKCDKSNNFKMKNGSKLKYSNIFIVTSVLLYYMSPSFLYLINTDSKQPTISYISYLAISPCASKCVKSASNKGVFSK